MRLLIFLAVIYFGYRAVKRWVLGSSTPEQGGRGNTGGAIEDVMVKDPQCGIYFPLRDGIRLRQGNEELHFCSTQCRDAFIADQKQGPQA